MLALLLAAAIAAPDVVIISVDTLRADRLGCYGYGPNTSPNIDALAESALLFEDVVCEIPLTAPSFSSMMTSRFPRSIGTTRNGLRLDSTIPTVAEIFKNAGYQTLCVQSNWTLKAKLSGLDRGFDVYEDAFRKGRWGLVKAERDATEVTRIALELLDNRDKTKPLFAWFHYSDPHAPYQMQRPFKVSDTGPVPGRKAQQISVRYDSEIAYADHHISRVLEALPRENTFVVFVGDHGESLFEHDYLGHGRRIYQTGMHIPFMVKGPGVEAGRSTFPGRGIDVGTTLLAMAGLPAAPGMVGVDLLTAAEGGSRPRVIETYGGAVPKLPGARALMANRPPQLQGVLFSGWKLIVDASRTQLYAIEEDPMEERDLSKEYPDRVSELLAMVEAWNARFPRASESNAELSDEDLEALEALGYVH